MRMLRFGRRRRPRGIDVRDMLPPPGLAGWDPEPGWAFRVRTPHGELLTVIALDEGVEARREIASVLARVG